MTHLVKYCKSSKDYDEKNILIEGLKHMEKSKAITNLVLQLLQEDMLQSFYDPCH